MTLNETRAFLGFALQQIAAESYFDDININNPDDVNGALGRGNNRQGFPETSFTRMPTLQVQQFTQRYQIIDQHANDATGFSATLMLDRTTDEYTLSFRSTEFREQADGGDNERDSRRGADGEIVADGFAVGQLAAMEDYYAKLKQGITSDGTIDPTLQAFFANGGKLNVTGYSLGGHLATVFTELHQDDVNQTYLFNAAGRGRMAGFSGTSASVLTSEEAQMAAMIRRFSEVLLTPGAGLKSVDDQNLALYTAARDAGPWDPFDAGSTGPQYHNAYADPRYKWAKFVVSREFSTVSAANIEVTTGLQGIAATEGAFAKMSSIYGQATTGETRLITGDIEVTANVGLHRTAQSVYIEASPYSKMLWD